MGALWRYMVEQARGYDRPVGRQGRVVPMKNDLHRGRLQWLAIALWAVVAVMYVVMAIPDTRSWIQGIDDWFYTMAVDGESSGLVTIAKALSFIGSSTIMFPLVLLVAGYLYWKKMLGATWFWVAALAIAEALIWITKFAYARPRPPMGLVATHSYSFPSGHAGTAAAVAVGFLFLLALHRQRHWYLDVLGVMYVLAIAWSRVYLRAHWFSDVFTGAALGAAVVVTAFLVVSSLRSRGATTT